MKLCPSQQRALDGLLSAIPLGSVFLLWGGPGMGKSSVLRELHGALGGALLTMKEFVEELE